MAGNPDYDVRNLKARGDGGLMEMIEQRLAEKRAIQDAEDTAFIRSYPERRVGKFDQDAQERFLKNYMLTGQIWASARAAGVSEECIRNYRNNNYHGFGDRFEEARGIYRDMIEGEVQRRAIEGYLEPVIGGKDHDEVVGYVRRFSDRLIEFLAKKHIPEFREKQQLDVNVTGGVMVIPSTPTGAEDWSEQYKDLERPTDQSYMHPVIEGEISKKTQE